MGVITNHVNFSESFTQIPNTWIRDGRLSHRARGVLAVILSHREGWETTTTQLVENGTEGRAAIRAALSELVEAGYLRYERVSGEGGRLAGSRYVTQMPPDRETENRSPGIEPPGDRKPVARKPDAQESPTKNTNLKNTNEKNTRRTSSSPAGDGDDRFAEFWAVYPRRVGKRKALERWQAAIKRATPDEIIAGARAYAASVQGKDQKFIKHPEGWLSGDRWDDERPSQPRHLSWADAL